MFNINYIYVYAVLCAVLVVCEEKVVNTTHGRISGKVFRSLFKNEEYVGFIGIPYAAPPVKDLRFLVGKIYYVTELFITLLTRVIF